MREAGPNGGAADRQQIFERPHPVIRTALLVSAVAVVLTAPGTALAGPPGEDDARYGVEASKKGKLRDALGYFKRAIQARGLKGYQLSAVYVNRGFTSHIKGLRARESDALLNMLYDHIAYGLIFQVRFQWEPNSVAIWLP